MQHEIPNCYYRLSTKALIFNDEGKFLLAKEAKGVWEFPGGGLDFGEEAHAGLRREINEEMNLDIETISENPMHFITFKDKGIWRANIFYTVTLKNLDFTPSDECVEIKFFTKEEVLADAEHMLPNILEFVKLI
jgi:8-oxo-dGTP pyrophosphatase MutT (NUDIX family)